GVTVDPLPNHRFRGFERRFASPMTLKPVGVIDVRLRGYYIAGTDEETMYLAHQGRVDHVLEVNVFTHDTVHHHIEMPSMEYYSLTMKVQPPAFYLLDGAGQKTYRGLISNWKAALYIDRLWYANAEPLSDGQMVLFSMQN